MPTITKFEDLEIWQMARIQANEVYNLSKEFKTDFDLINQINAAAGSVMDNIAEGFERFSKNEFRQFLIIAKGSNAEVRSQLYRAFDKKYFMESILQTRLDYSETIGKKIYSFINYLITTEYKTKPTGK